MKKIIIALVTILCLFVSLPAFAATNTSSAPAPKPTTPILPMTATEPPIVQETTIDFIFVSEPELTPVNAGFDKYIDGNTGLMFEYPERWSLKIDKRVVDATSNPYIRRTITLANAQETFFVKIVQLNPAGNLQRYIVNVNNEGFYYLSGTGLAILDSLVISEADLNDPDHKANSHEAEHILSSLEFVN